MSSIQILLAEKGQEILDWLHIELPAKGFVHPFTCMLAGVNGSFQVVSIEAVAEYPVVEARDGRESSMTLPVKFLVVDSSGEVDRLIISSEPPTLAEKNEQQLAAEIRKAQKAYDRLLAIDPRPLSEEKQAQLYLDRRLADARLDSAKRAARH